MELALFTLEDGRSLDWEVFLRHDLGQLWQTIPFRALAEKFPQKKNKAGAKGRFDIAGGIGLQVLKHYIGCSDDKLIQLLNGNWMMQYFCGICLKAGEQIKDSDVVSRWRGYLGAHLDMDQLQEVLANTWSEHMQQTHTNLTDASCYESHVRYPTDVKLLWESIDWLWHQIKQIYRHLKIALPRNKYRDQKKKYLSYQKRRKKTYKQKRRIQARLLYLLNKLLGLVPNVLTLLEVSPRMGKNPVKSNFFDRLKLVRQIYRQQKSLYENPTQSVAHRIVSLAKPYLRPIVRGKETKRVEFGMKVNKMQIDGINFIEYADFEPFHEGIRLKQTIWKHRQYFQKCTHVAADQIYATNANRKYCTQNGITTCFKRKGRAAKNEEQAQQMRQILAKARATRLEGSFGNEKNHYLLGRIKAKKYHTEKCWMFFGVFTANAVAMSKRINAPPTAA